MFSIFKSKNPLTSENIKLIKQSSKAFADLAVKSSNHLCEIIGELAENNHKDRIAFQYLLWNLHLIKFSLLKNMAKHKDSDEAIFVKPIFEFFYKECKTNFETELHILNTNYIDNDFDKNAMIILAALEELPLVLEKVNFSIPASAHDFIMNNIANCVGYKKKGILIEVVVANVDLKDAIRKLEMLDKLFDIMRKNL